MRFDIKIPDTAISPLITDKIDNLNKPKGSLGLVEKIAHRICMAQQTLTPSLKNPCHILFGGDHGIEREGVSVSPRDVTWQQMINFTKGGGGVNMFCRQHGFRLFIVDVGVDYDLTQYSDIINRKIARGTDNFLYHSAMSLDQLNKSFSIGAEMVDRCVEYGSNIICLGEMGIANTSASSMLMHVFGDIPLEECVGIGSGVNSEGLLHKLKILKQSAVNFGKNTTQPSAEEVVAYFSGFEMAAATGAMLRAAEKGVLILVDGFIMTACMLSAARICPEVLHYAIFGHCGDESGHKKMLSLLNAEPILSLGLRLGEGTGALCAYPIVESAVKMVNEMNNFRDANITKYF